MQAACLRPTRPCQRPLAHSESAGCAEERCAAQQVAVLSLGTGCTITPALLDPSQAGVLSWLSPDKADLVSLLMSGAQELSTSLLAAQMQAVRSTGPRLCAASAYARCLVHTGVHAVDARVAHAEYNFTWAQGSARCKAPGCQ